MHWEDPLEVSVYNATTGEWCGNQSQKNATEVQPVETEDTAVARRRTAAADAVEVCSVPGFLRSSMERMSGSNEGLEVQYPVIRVATFNLWFSSKYRHERTVAVLDILHQEEAHVICLQEVTPDFLKQLLAEPWVQERYSITHKDQASLGVMKYATVMLSRLEVVSYSLHELPSFMDRKLITGQFKVYGHQIIVGTVHLESELQVQSRQQQMQCLHQWLGEKNLSYIIAGDFNFGTEAVENQSLEAYQWMDVWATKKRNEEGFTRDTVTNKLLHAQYPDGLQARFDRVVAHTCESSSCGLEPAHIERLGLEPVSPELPQVHPSDHYGLSATLLVLTQEESAARRRRNTGSRCCVQ